jgi:hypothetical protein
LDGELLRWRKETVGADDDPLSRWTLEPNVWSTNSFTFLKQKKEREWSSAHGRSSNFTWKSPEEMGCIPMGLGGNHGQVG